MVWVTQPNPPNFWVKWGVLARNPKANTLYTPNSNMSCGRGTYVG